ncbi:hypothetical protein FHT02_003932 [Sphingomonas xinjiangensis]|uniref:Uncharacterized protein n=1 Tax=Sphingomonas xinjiangensis TaxID=643568 RepID=A0A840YSN1_9SPHN|nr:hypothetical protein [Sphingomonas xinjiangensis]
MIRVPHEHDIGLRARGEKLAVRIGIAAEPWPVFAQHPVPLLLPALVVLRTRGEREREAGGEQRAANEVGHNASRSEHTGARSFAS